MKRLAIAAMGLLALGAPALGARAADITRLVAPAHRSDRDLGQGSWRL